MNRSRNGVPAIRDLLGREGDSRDTCGATCLAAAKSVSVLGALSHSHASGSRTVGLCCAYNAGFSKRGRARVRGGITFYSEHPVATATAGGTCVSSVRWSVRGVSADWSESTSGVVALRADSWPAHSSYPWLARRCDRRSAFDLFGSGCAGVWGKELCLGGLRLHR